MGKYSIIWNDDVMRGNLKNARAIYIPMRVDKVMIPYERDGTSYLLEELVLKLLYSRGRDAEAIADILRLPLTLIESVYNKLANEGYIDKGSFTLTESGRLALLELKEKSEKKEPMYIFYDLVGGQYWNTVLPEEEYRKLKFRESVISEKDSCKTMRLNIGTEGNPNKILLRYLPIFEDKKKEPTPKEVFETVKEHRRLLNEMEYEKVNIPQSYYIKSPKPSYNVNIFDVGEVCYVGTIVYVPEDISRHNEWQVLNPFGFGEAGFYKEILERKFLGQNEDRVFKVCIKELYKNIGEDARGNVSFDEGDSYLKEIFSLEIDEYPEVKNTLKETLDKYLKLSSVEKEGNKNQERKKAAEEYLTTIFSAMEKALKIAEEKVDGDKNRVSQGMEGTNALKIRTVAEKIGFNVDEKETPLGVKVEALKYSNALLPLVARNILLETDGIKAVARHNREFIYDIYQLKKLRDMAGHDSGVDIDPDIILEYNKSFFREIGDLLRIGCWNYVEYSEFINSENNKRLKEYLAEESKIYNTELGKVRVEKLDRNIEKYLTNLRCYFKFLEKRIGNPRSIDAVLSISKIYEALLTKVSKSILKEEAKDIVSNDSDENLEMVKEVLKDYGFLSREKTQKEIEFDDKFLTVDVNKIRDTFTNFEKGVISTKSYAILFSLVNQEKNNEMVKLGEMAPEFFNFGVKLDRARGHGNKEVGMLELEYLSSGIEELLKVFKNLFK